MRLTAARAKELLNYDPETGNLTWRIDRPSGDRGQILQGKAGDTAGTATSDGYRQVCLDSRIYKAHRVIWLMVHGRWPKKSLDHKNLEPGDNRIVNLREASDRENQGNRRKLSNNTSGYKGVHLHKPSGKWKAQIGFDGKRKHLGLFETPELAFAAYIQAAKEVFGEFARSE